MQTYFKYLNNSIIVYSQPLITRPQNSLKALSGGTVTSQCLRLLLDSSISPLKESYAGICFLISPTLLVNNAHSWIASTFIESIFCALFEKPPVVKCWELALPFPPQLYSTVLLLMNILRYLHRKLNSSGQAWFIHVCCFQCVSVTVKTLWARTNVRLVRGAP